MTTFADREHAIEAHYALLELVAFRERARRHKRLGIRLAARLNLHGADGRLFAVSLSERCADEPSDESLYRRMADELGLRGLTVSDADIRHLALSGGSPGRSAFVAPPVRPWVEFVTAELLSLFGDARQQPPSLPDQPHSIPAA
ncbi:MAG: hypothetical protein JWM91_345 [Rhodospirillales bacterium]|nr:hypothetical protein [Rhodospirillales bacterium]